MREQRGQLPTMRSEHAIFDTDLLDRRHRRIASGAQKHDFLLRRVAEDFAERLLLIKRTFPHALDLGRHAGVLAARLGASAAIGEFIVAGPAQARPAQSASAHVAASEEALPFAAASFDLVVSGLSLQFVNDLPGALIQIRRILKPDGLLLAALFGGDTLRELREAWFVAEEEITGGASPRVAPFADVRDLGGLLQRAGFALPVADSDTVRVTYATPLELMREVKGMGASNMLRARRRVPVTRKLLGRACEVYADRFALPDGRIPATFEIVTLTAWAPDESQQKPLQPGSAKARLADALGVTEQVAGEKAGKPPEKS